MAKQRWKKALRWIGIGLLVLVLIAAGFGAYGLYKVKQPPSSDEMLAVQAAFNKRKMSIVSADTRERHEFELEIANNQQQHALGLMYRDDVPQGTGMLFLFAPPREVVFWMKNTKVPLDMLFIRMNGTIARIVENTKPYDLAPISSEEPVFGVLEIRGGEAKRLGIKVGDYLQ